ncbi:MAG: TerB family tellurite resistance protein, partial [Deltaproteobacteria bacterium]|nr:TerB family tellurite resistance protein [Deltaproteobacteria bacterium]
MSDESLKPVFINMYLLAAADGRTDPTEVEYLSRFCELAGIAAEQAAAWRKEVDSSENAFREIEDQAVAAKYLGIMARMVRVDGVFDESEQSAYIAMGKTLGFDHEQLGDALREHWDSDPLERFTKPVPPPAQATEKPGDVVIVEDDMVEQAELTASAPGVVLTYVTMESLSHRALEPRIVLFHAAQDKQPS